MPDGGNRPPKSQTARILAQRLYGHLRDIILQNPAEFGAETLDGTSEEVSDGFTAAAMDAMTFTKVMEAGNATAPEVAQDPGYRRSPFDVPPEPPKKEPEPPVIEPPPTQGEQPNEAAVPKSGDGVCPFFHPPNFCRYERYCLHVCTGWCKTAAAERRRTAE